MGCFLGCFGGSKDRKRLKQRNKVPPRDKQSHECSSAHQIYALSEQKPVVSSPISLVSDLQDKSEEKSSSSSKKCATFDSNVKTSEQVSPLRESKDSLPETYSLTAEEEIEQQTSAKVKQPLSSSEENPGTSSVGSYPPNYRYQNCRDSDDEIDECGGHSGLEDVDGDVDYEEGYFNDDDSGDCAFVGQVEDWRESVLTTSMESRTKNLSSVTLSVKDVENTKSPGDDARDKSDDIYPVMNLVENLSRWKSVNTRDASQLTLEKENIISFAPETPCMSPPSFVQPIVKQSSSCVKPTSAQSDGVPVDASLSSWLITASESSTPSNTNCLESVSSEKSSKSQSSNYVRNLNDRPILGALTVEELKQFSKYSSPRRSPSRSPDEIPIIGTVGTYWNDSMLEKDSRSVSSYKGIPNTNSKYREDKKVNWHSTPFEKRLERALKKL